MTANKYDVFIAYRRPDGASGRKIDAALANHGVYPFVHLTDISRGHFEFALLKRVAETPNFLLILTPGSLDRCHETGDRLRQEIGQAIRTSRNIIPLLMPGFEYPAELPRDLQSLRRYEGVASCQGLSPSVLAVIRERICTGTRRQRYLAKRRIVVTRLIAVVILAAMIVGTRYLPAAASVAWEYLRRGPRPATQAKMSQTGRTEVIVAGVRGTADESLPPAQRITYSYGASPRDRTSVIVSPIESWSSRGSP